ncbi:MAG: LamG domain-containing protein [Sedimentisphaerales bacterium]|jgi:hypothetical protein
MCRKWVYLISFVLVTTLVSNASGGLVGHWKLDEGSGTIAHDSSRNENHGTLDGPIWRPSEGQIGGALEFDGTDDYVEVPDDASFDITNEITVTAWIKPGDVIDWRTIVAKYAHTPAWRKDLYWLLHAGNIGVTFAGPCGIGGDDWIPTVPIESGVWAHVAVSYDGSAMRMYKNGINAATNSASGNLLLGDSASNESFYIGYNTEWSEFFDGLIDDVYLYDRTLTPDQVQNLFNGIPPTFATAFNPNPSDGAFHADTWINLSWSAGDSAVSHDVYLGDNLAGVNKGNRDSDVFRGNQTSTYYVAGFPGFAYPDGLSPGETYYWRIDEVNEADPNSPWKGNVWGFSIPPKTAYNPNPADGAESVGPDNVTLSWTPGFGAKLHSVYFGGNYDDVNNAGGGAPGGMATYRPGTLEREKVYYWRVDEFDATTTYKGHVWYFTTPGAVGNPQPAYEAADVQMNVILSWTPADSATSQEIYLGMDEAAVRSADTGSPEYKGTKALGGENFDPGLLEPQTSYFWRVDEVDDQGNTSMGPLWRFTTGDFLLVDDFESYTNDDAAGQAIWQTWIDGFGVPDNGAQVGYLLPPYAEQTVVHGGQQSMPLLYENAADVTNSEGSMALALRDWTAAGVEQLSLWFRGRSTNAAEPLYVALSNAAGALAVITHDDASAAQFITWTNWVIPLQTFADQGINLTNVDKMAIGLGSKGGAAAGGSGTIYIDDMRLYRP